MIMKNFRILFTVMHVLAILLLAGWVAPPAAAQDLVEWVTMRDGTKFKAHVWFPKGPGPWPVVLQRFYQAGSFPNGRDRFLSAGYATAHAEIRDANGTIGTRFTRDDLDGYDTVEWIAKQPWCNDQVVMYGKSCGGITAFAAATARPPHLKAICPEHRQRLPSRHWLRLSLRVGVMVCQMISVPVPASRTSRMWVASRSPT